MPNPKRRHSQSRRRKRRSHDAISSPTVTLCNHCGEPIQPHRVCPACGYYRGRQVVEKEE